MKCAAIPMSTAQAAYSWLPEDFLNHPCGNCGDGKGQHFDKLFRGGVARNDRGHGPCSRPGCSCTQYVSREELAYYGA